MDACRIASVWPSVRCSLARRSPATQSVAAQARTPVGPRVPRRLGMVLHAGGSRAGPSPVRARGATGVPRYGWPGAGGGPGDVDGLEPEGPQEPGPSALTERGGRRCRLDEAERAALPPGAAPLSPIGCQPQPIPQKLALPLPPAPLRAWAPAPDHVGPREPLAAATPGTEMEPETHEGDSRVDSRPRFPPPTPAKGERWAAIPLLALLFT